MSLSRNPTHAANVKEHTLERFILFLANLEKTGTVIHDGARHVLVGIEGVCGRTMTYERDASCTATARRVPVARRRSVVPVSIMPDVGLRISVSP